MHSSEFVLQARPRCLVPTKTGRLESPRCSILPSFLSGAATSQCVSVPIVQFLRVSASPTLLFPSSEARSSTCSSTLRSKAGSSQRCHRNCTGCASKSVAGLATARSASAGWQGHLWRTAPCAIAKVIGVVVLCRRGLASRGSSTRGSSCAGHLGALQPLSASGACCPSCLATVDAAFSGSCSNDRC